MTQLQSRSRPETTSAAATGPETTLAEDVPVDHTGVIHAQRRLIRRQRIFIGIALAATALSIVGLFASSFVKSPAQQAAETAPPKASLVTATVKQDILRSTIVTRGMVAASSQFRITPTASAQGAANLVVTAIHTSVGLQIASGSVPLEISGRPLIALPGLLPTYRDLKPNDHGDDVAELQQALNTLGDYKGGDASGYFGPATKRGVEALYSHLGYDVPTTGGPDDEGDKAALQSAQAAVDSAQRAVNDMQLQINTGTPSTPGQEPLPLQMKYLRQALKQAQKAQADLVARTGPMLPEAEAFFLPTFPSYVAQFSAKIGDTVSAPLLTVSSGTLGITADMTTDQGSLLKPGMAVSINAEALNLSASGTVTNVGTITVDNSSAGTAGTTAPTSSQSQPGVPYIPVTISAAEPLTANWNQQDVRLTITEAATSGPVLIVPLSAVSESADGSVTVSKATSGSNVVSVPVTAGLSGNGMVQVTPAVPGALQAGDRVLVSDTNTTQPGNGS